MRVNRAGEEKESLIESEECIELMCFLCLNFSISTSAAARKREIEDFLLTETFSGIWIIKSKTVQQYNKSSVAL